MAGVEETTLSLRNFHTLRKRNPKDSDLRFVVDGDAFFFLLVELKRDDNIEILFLSNGKGKVAVGAMVICAMTVCAAAMVIVCHRMQCLGRWAQAMAILKEFEEKCVMPIGKLRQVADAMTVEMHANLVFEGGSKLKMLIGYVDNIDFASWN